MRADLPGDAREVAPPDAAGDPELFHLFIARAKIGTVEARPAIPGRAEARMDFAPEQVEPAPCVAQEELVHPASLIPKELAAAGRFTVCRFQPRHQIDRKPLRQQQIGRELRLRVAVEIAGAHGAAPHHIAFHRHAEFAAEDDLVRQAATGLARNAVSDARADIAHLRKR